MTWCYGREAEAPTERVALAFLGNPRETFVCFLLCVSGMAREKGRREVGEKLHKVLLAISFIIPVLCVQ